MQKQLPVGDAAVNPMNLLKNMSAVNSGGRVTTDGTTTMSGYTIIEADSINPII